MANEWWQANEAKKELIPLPVRRPVMPRFRDGQLHSFVAQNFFSAIVLKAFADSSYH